jgi:hypothetical protein
MIRSSVLALIAALQLQAITVREPVVFPDTGRYSIQVDNVPATCDLVMEYLENGEWKNFITMEYTLCDSMTVVDLDLQEQRYWRFRVTYKPVIVKQPSDLWISGDPEFLKQFSF